MYKNILVAYDGSDGATLALKRAIVFAKETGADLTALWVQGSLPYFAETIDEIEAGKEQAISYSKKLNHEISELCKKEKLPVNYISVQGHPSKMIVEYAIKHQVHLIIMGHSGHSNLWGNLLGHTTDNVSDHAQCDVLIVRK